MKIVKIFLYIFFVFLFHNIKAQNPPKPIDLPFFNLIEGTWTAQSDMMGMKMNEELTCAMSLNKQFLVMNLTAGSEDKTHTYTGMGVFGCDDKGNVTSWWFDHWGVTGTSSGTGKIDGLKMITDDKSVNYTTNRTLELTGGQLVMKFSRTVKTPDGKEVPISGETIYNKTK